MTRGIYTQRDSRIGFACAGIPAFASAKIAPISNHNVIHNFPLFDTTDLHAKAAVEAALLE